MSGCDSLVTWLRTVENKEFTDRDLLDGCLIASALQAISPSFFTQQWMTRIKADVGDNWRLKVMNLKKIVTGIEDYYSELLNQRLPEDLLPDVNKIGEQGDVEELAHLLTLVLGCAVNCEEKQEYIRRIMSLEERVQQDVMNAIQELMSRDAIISNEASSPRSHDDSISQQVRKLQEQVVTLTEDKDQLRQRCHELDVQVASLLEEKSMLILENEKLSERLSQAENLDESHWNEWSESFRSSAVGKRFQQLKTRVEQLQGELNALEIERDDLKIRYDLQAKDLIQQQQKSQELGLLASQAAALKDEVDILRHSADKLEKCEAAVESYKRKIEDMADLRNEAKLLEERNSEYLKKNIALEEEVKKLQSIRSQIEMYRLKTVELERKTSELTKRAEEAEFNAKRLQEKVDSLQLERERLVAERNSLQENQESLHSIQRTAVDGNVSPYGAPSTPSLELVSLPYTVREKLKRLEHENEMLRMRAEGSEAERVQLLEEQLIMADSKKTELETELRSMRETVLTLRAELSDFTSSNHQSVSEASSTVKVRLQERSARCDELESELRSALRRAEAAEILGKEGSGRIKLLEETIKQKDVQMAEIEERYKKYLEKAKSVIQGLGRSASSNSVPPEVQMLQSQVEEKTRIIDMMERDNERFKSVREQEERLMVSAWYNLGSQLYRRSMEDRLSSSGGSGQSFLARQRQIHIHHNASGGNNAPPR